MLAYYGARSVEPQWDIPFPLRDEYRRTRPWFRAMVARPFLPDYFPGYDCYLWIDADAWVQDGGVLQELIKAARDHGCAGVPEIDRSYLKFITDPRIWETERICYRECFPEKLAQKLDYRPQINTGVLAISAASPVWQSWKNYLATGLSETPNRVVEQLAFNLAVWCDGPSIAMLPSTFNWIAGMAPPAFDGRQGLFVNPQPPHEKIRILHLTAPVMGRFARIPLLGVTGEPGGEMWHCLEYDFFRNRVSRG